MLIWFTPPPRPNLQLLHLSLSHLTPVLDFPPELLVLCFILVQSTNQSGSLVTGKLCHQHGNFGIFETHIEGRSKEVHARWERTGWKVGLLGEGNQGNWRGFLQHCTIFCTGKRCGIHLRRRRNLCKGYR